MKDMPEKDELVIATIRKIFPYGAFCVLDGYGNREAFIHISEVASRWVKNIHEFLKENQKVVARVHHFLPEKNQIDLSIRRVSEAEKKLKLESVKRQKRAMSLLVVVAKRLKKDPKMFSKEMYSLFEAEFGEAMDAFERISTEPDETLKRLKLPKETAEALREIASQNVKKPKVEVSRILEMSSTNPDGVDSIKAILESLGAMGTDKTSIDVTYLGAPKYKLRIISEDYKTAEKVISEVSGKADEFKKHGVSLSISSEAR